jgi:hypothetical protein
MTAPGAKSKPWSRRSSPREAMDDISASRRTWIAVAILLALLISVAVPLSLWASGGSQSSEDGGGDNPVVGSLPCAVDPDMDLKFWKALCGGVKSGTIMRPVPTLSLAGVGLSSYVPDAWGGAGSVNGGGTSWSLLGLMQQGGMVTTRAAVLSGKVSLWNWLPASYYGGRVLMACPSSAWNWSITESCFVLPLTQLCASTAPVVDATFTVSGANASVAVVKYRVVILGEVVTVSFL